LRKLRERDEFNINYDAEHDMLVIFDLAKKIQFGATAEFLLKMIAKVDLKVIVYED